MALSKAAIPILHRSVSELMENGHRPDHESDPIEDDNSMPELVAIELKAHVPARDFEVSKQFYQDIGFTLC